MLTRKLCSSMTLAFATLCGGLSVDSLAQGYPAKPIVLVVPVAPGGPIDFVARTISPELAKILGQSIVVENRAGASQKIGTQYLLRTTDGYTIGMVSPTSLTIGPVQDKQIGYDPLKDFAFLSTVVETPFVLVANPKLGVRSMTELAVFARANPGKVTYGSGGDGTIAHLVAQAVMAKLGASALHVPYKSTGPAFNALMAGEIDLFVQSSLLTKPHIESGKLIGLGTTSSERWDRLPGVPTLAESGPTELRGFSYKSWMGMACAAGVPPEIAARLHQAIIASLKTSRVMEVFTNAGWLVVPSSPEEFRRRVQEELALHRTLL
ncbi:MAG: Bug family tripartite tricarboxylate transporter substrate binding protein [Burkholderiales bacterium]